MSSRIVSITLRRQNEPLRINAPSLNEPYYSDPSDYLRKPFSTPSYWAVSPRISCRLLRSHGIKGNEVSIFLHHKLYDVRYPPYAKSFKTSVTHCDPRRRPARPKKP